MATGDFWSADSGSSPPLSRWRVHQRHSAVKIERFCFRTSWWKSKRYVILVVRWSPSSETTHLFIAPRSTENSIMDTSVRVWSSWFLYTRRKLGIVTALSPWRMFQCESPLKSIALLPYCVVKIQIQVKLDAGVSPFGPDLLNKSSFYSTSSNKNSNIDTMSWCRTAWWNSKRKWSWMLACLRVSPRSEATYFFKHIVPQKL